VNYCEECFGEFSTENFTYLLNKSVVFSTKIDAVLKVLIENAQRGKKTILFSQFTSSLSNVEVALQIFGLKYVRFDGTMTPDQKAEALRKFRSNPECMVFCASLKAAAVGLNITCASEVVFLDVWFNPFVEDQAIARVHRMGQRDQVRVTRFQIERSVEERILQLQVKKREVANDLLAKQPKLSHSDLLYVLGV
jgi:SNF2 family DNA or RNA helicase